jgi:hypothetical protein
MPPLMCDIAAAWWPRRVWEMRTFVLKGGYEGAHLKIDEQNTSHQWDVSGLLSLDVLRP